MFDFEDDLPIGSQRIPLLIWIQILVMLLLLILLYYFTISAFGLDPSPTATATATAVAASPSAVLYTQTSTHRTPPTAAAASSSSSRLNSAKAGESHSIKGDAGTSTSRRRVRREEIQEREGSSSAKDATNASAFGRYYHPCHFLGLAGQAFLKCLGLDPPSNDPSSNTRHRKEK